MQQFAYRNLLAYPGGQPGFNPAHFAAGPSCRFSGVATGNEFISLTDPRQMTIYGSSVLWLQLPIGPTLYADTTTYTGCVQLPCIADAAASAVTFSAIFTTPASLSNSNMLLAIGSFNPKWGVIIATTGSIKLYLNSSTYNVMPITGNGTWFYAASCSTSIGINAVLLNLSTGQLRTLVTAGPASLSQPTASLIGINGIPNSSAYGFGGGVAAAMASVNNFLSLTQLLAWARDPWSFWYQPTFKQYAQNYITSPTTDYIINTSNLSIPQP